MAMILKGDCIEVMKAMKPNSVDAIVCDPPYGLEFMGKEWDKFVSTPPPFRKHKKSYYKEQGERRDKSNLKENRFNFINESYKYIKETIEHRHYFQEWCSQWLSEAYQVLKPGGSMLVMGGTRTSHRLTCAIEDSGFIIKDTLMWIYGSGFPKAQDLGKMIDKRMGLKIENKSEFIGVSKLQDNTKTIKRYKVCTECGKPLFGPDYCHCEWRTKSNNEWQGFKVGGIKPAYEPIIWAVKPPEGSYVDNVLKWGVGAVNVDECRIGYQDNGDKEIAHKNALGPIERYKTHKQIYGGGRKSAGFEDTHSPKGRFPANIILGHHPECNEGCHPDCAVRMLDEQSGNGKSPNTYKRKADGLNQFSYGKGMGELTGKESLNFGDSGGASRFFYCAKASRGERNAGLDELPDKLPGQSGGATQALKNGKSEYIQKDHIGLNKIKIVKNNHPTVKPIKLFEWLIKLVTREGQIILDPFIGSGTTAIASHNTGRKCVGIEKEGEYLEIAKRRIDYWENQPKQMEMRI